MLRLLESKEAKVSLSSNDITSYPEYDQRHIMDLIKTPSWSEQQKKTQLTHNRILQPDYLACDPASLVEMSKLTHQDWLTDIAPITFKAALYFNICAELLTFYQLKLSDCNVIANEIYLRIMNNNETKALESLIQFELSYRPLEIHRKVNQKLEKKLEEIPSLANEEAYVKEALYFIELCIMRKEITNAYLETYLSPIVSQFASKLCITKKPTFPFNTNHDVCIVGAAGSGKSSIINQIMQGKKSEYITICTDDYRGFYLPCATQFENFDPDKQRFICTQDTAYLIKELIGRRLRPDKIQEGRPNIYIDAINLEEWQQELLRHSHFINSSIAALSNVNQVPKRVYLRAQTSTDPADCKRYVNTTALLNSHSKASQHLLTNIPTNTITTIYDTNVPREQKPILMGRINNKNGNHSIVVTNLSRFCDYMGKANINCEATFAGLLFFDEHRTKYRFTYDILSKAEQLLKTLKPNPHQPNIYSLFIHHELNDKPICKIGYETSGKYFIEVMDKMLFKELLNSADKKQKQQLEAILLLICYGDKVRTELEVLGKKGALFAAMKLLKLDEYLTPFSRKVHTI